MQIPEQTKLALNYLIQTAASEGVTIAGFAFRVTPPCLINFGNCSDSGDLKLYESLCGLASEKKASEKKASGQVFTETVQMPN